MVEGGPLAALLPNLGTSDRTRTGTLVARDFKSLVSTNSTTEALLACPEGFEPPT